MNLITTSFWSAVATVLRMVTGFLVNKVLAIYVGPGGIALLGQFNNYIGVLTTFSNGGINTGVTKYIAQYGGNCDSQKELAQTALRIAFYCSFLFGIITFIFASIICRALFNSEQYLVIIQISAISLVFASINSTLLSILNGYKQIKMYLVIGIVNSLIGLILTFYLVVQYTIHGALLSVILTQSIVCIITILYVKRFNWFNFSFIKFNFNKKIVKQLLNYTLMAITSAAIVPVTQILVRNYLTEHLSLIDAGYCQAVWKISDVYLMVITTSLSTYYLPRLSEITDKIELKKEVLLGYKILLPITVIMALVIYGFRQYIILILFTPDFMPMSELFLFQQIGDILKISSWLLGFLLLAKAMTKTFILTEIIFGFSFVEFVCFFVEKFGLIGVSYGYALNYLIHFIVMYLVIRKNFFNKI